MNDPFMPRVGGILSADIAVPEHEREVRFYSSVLTTGEHPFWRKDLMNNRGMPIIGLGAQSPEYADLPLQWMPHIQVADVATSAARALELGGDELMHGKDDDGNSQWAVLLDPSGAAFGVIPVVSAESMPASADIASPAGRICGLTLTVPDATAMRGFYKQVVGWSARNVEMQDAKEGGATITDSEMLDDDGNPAARIRHARGANAGLPPVWLIHLPVGDLSESLRRVKEGGGEVLAETQNTDRTDASAVIQDPVGACLALMQG